MLCHYVAHLLVCSSDNCSSCMLLPLSLDGTDRLIDGWTGTQPLHRCLLHTAHTHPFNGPFSGTTWVSQYQKGKTNLDFTEARDSEWQWHQLGHVTLAARSPEDRLQSGSADIQSPQHLYAIVPATPNPGSRTRPQPVIDHYGAVSTFHGNICETRFSMLCTSCLELSTANCSH